MAPAIKLAEDGIVVTFALTAALLGEEEHLKKWPATVNIFFHPDGSVVKPGEILKQPDLAAALRRIIEQGRDDFYQGETAEKMVAAIKAGDGLMSLEDLAGIRPQFALVRGSYRDYEVVSMPPPSSSGVHIIQMLNYVERL